MYELTPDDFAIQKQIEILDAVTIDYEARWGIGTLTTLASPDMQNKWQRQMEKLNDAIQSSNLSDVTGLVQGTIRGYKVLEDHVTALGHKPACPDTWDVQHPESGRVYRICKNNIDASRATEKGVVTYTLEEIARTLEAQQLVNVVKENMTGATITNTKPTMDWERGDTIPF